MERGTDKTIVLNISSTGNKFETLSEFNDSYYSNEYDHAFRIVENLVSEAKNSDENKKKSNMKEMYNIIPFIGGRGSGKTSAMLSFSEALQQYFDVKEEKVYFTCLHSIDGSLLEDGEDIIKVILAEMYGKFLEGDYHAAGKNKENDYDRRELQHSFDEIYRAVCELENGKDKIWEESSIVSLRNLSSSLQLKEKFAKLIRCYLRTISRKNACEQQTNKHFLVVIIDDLDLNVDSGFDMLEKIHRYLMIPQVIVLLAVDYKQMKMLCEEHFYEQVPKVNDVLLERKPYIETLAKDLLDKVLPYNMRVYMPMLKKKKNIFIQMDENRKVVEIKQAIFNTIYRNIGMRLDGSGEKRHFYEPETMRGLANLYLMLTGMEALFDNAELKTEEEFGKIYDNNYSIMLADVMTRMVEEGLDAYSVRLFKTLTDTNLVRSCRNVVYYVRTNCAELVELSKDIETYDYSYGELLRVLYCWGRMGDGEKQLVKCLLAYFSIEMTRSFYRYSVQKDENYKKVFLEVLNGSFAGSWANRMLPEVNISLSLGNESRAIKSGIIGGVNMEKAIQFRFWALDKDLIYTEERDRVLNFDTVYKEKNIQPQYEEYLRKMFRTVILGCMFFDQSTYKNSSLFSWDFKQKQASNLNTLKKLKGFMFIDDLVTEDYQEGEENSITICFNSEKKSEGVFNFFNFVSNVLKYKSNVKQIQEAVFKSIFGEQQEEKMQNFLKQLGVMQEFDEWAETSYGFVLPIYNLDLMYNMMKRIRQGMYNYHGGVIDTVKLWQYFQDILKMISNTLQKSDDYYYAEHDKMEVQFNNCPFVKWALNPSVYLTEDFDIQFKELIERVAGAGKAIDANTEETRIRSYDE